MLVDVLSVTLRALSFVALFQTAGMAIFLALFRRRLTVTADVTRRYGLLSAAAALVFVLAHYALEAARMSGDFAGVTDADMQALVLHSSTSTALALRVIGLTLIAIGLYSRRPNGIIIALIGAVLTLDAFTFVGHTTTHALHGLTRAVLLVHLLVVAFWFGALIPLAVVCAREPSTAGNVIASFSRLAIWLVPALFVAGLVLIVILVGSLATFSTPYGRLLLAKVGGFALLLIPAAINKWRLGEAVARGKPSARTWFRRSVAIEYVLMAGVLAATAVMTTFFSPDET